MFWLTKSAMINQLSCHQLDMLTTLLSLVIAIGEKVILTSVVSPATDAEKVLPVGDVELRNADAVKVGYVTAASVASAGTVIVIGLPVTAGCNPGCRCESASQGV